MTDSEILRYLLDALERRAREWERAAPSPEARDLRELVLATRSAAGIDT